MSHFGKSLDKVMTALFEFSLYLGKIWGEILEKYRNSI